MLIINADQTPSKYVPVGQSTLAEKNVKDVPISGSADKRSITATFAETLDDSFLPFQLIYNGKTTQSLPKIDFPDGFSLSVNEKHFSNTQESVKENNIIITECVPNNMTNYYQPLDCTTNKFFGKEFSQG